jgi:hypothetical protein
LATKRTVWAALFLGLIVWVECGWAQTLPDAQPQTQEDALHAMARLAGVIFTGQVIAVRHHNAAGGSSGMVEIEFAVEDAVRGVSEGGYTLREWAGLWAGGDEPFRVGQRYLMLLHAPSATGLSSPVGGMDGAIPIRGGGPAVPEAATSADELLVDLRWVATRVISPTGYATPATARPITVHAETAKPQASTKTTTSREAAYTSVLGMLRGWEKDDRAER